jgi:crossover junction endodeoxyribonuclease RuvC
MIILGIDPGLAIVGYGVIKVRSRQDMDCISYGCIRTEAGYPVSTRLQVIYEDMLQLLERYQPDQVAIERLYFKQNITTGIQVACAMGVILLALQQKGLIPSEYNPNQVKSRILGHGHAEKHQIQYMVQKVLKLDEKPKPDDAADGLAVALCHHYSNPLKRSR